MEELNKINEIQKEKDELFKSISETAQLQKEAYNKLITNAMAISRKYLKYCNADVAYGFLMGCLTELTCFNEIIKKMEQKEEPK